jgi:hypothetical protein
MYGGASSSTSLLSPSSQSSSTFQDFSKWQGFQHFYSNGKRCCHCYAWCQTDFKQKITKQGPEFFKTTFYTHWQDSISRPMCSQTDTMPVDQTWRAKNISNNFVCTYKHYISTYVVNRHTYLVFVIWEKMALLIGRFCYDFNCGTDVMIYKNIFAEKFVRKCWRFFAQTTAS